MKKPDFIAWIVNESTTEKGEQQAFWTKVGVAFRHKNGIGLNIVLTPGIAVTASKIILTEPKESEPSGSPIDF
jgi:hypothetical protein